MILFRGLKRMNATLQKKYSSSWPTWNLLLFIRVYPRSSAVENSFSSVAARPG
jgi:hypothetical protein